jgi:hypothetical protein
MNIRVMASVAFAILGAVALYSSILMIQGLLSIPAYADEYEGNHFLIIVAFAFPLLLMVTGGIALITQRDRLATWVAGDSGEEGEESEPGQLPELAFALLGLYLVISTLPSLGSLAVSLIDFRGWEDFESGVPVFRSNLGHYAGTLAQFVAGGCLFLYARTIGSWWRRRGSKKAERPVTPPCCCPACDHPFHPGDYRESVEEKRCSNCGELLPDGVFG